jgi:hypothetical protein
VSGMAETKAAKAATPDKAPAAAPEDTAPTATSTTPEPVKPGDQSQPATGTPDAAQDAAAQAPADAPAPDAAPSTPADVPATDENIAAAVDGANERKVTPENAHAIRRIDRLLMGVQLSEGDVEAIGEIVFAHLSPEAKAALNPDEK